MATVHGPVVPHHLDGGEWCIVFGWFSHLPPAPVLQSQRQEEQSNRALGEALGEDGEGRALFLGPSRDGSPTIQEI